MNLKERLATVRCKWCGTYNVHKCGYSPHKDWMGNTLSCSQCRGHDRLCNDPKHPSNKEKWDV